MHTFRSTAHFQPSALGVIAAACAAALTLAACAAPAAPPPRQAQVIAGGNAPLGGTSWTLATLAGQPPVGDTLPTLNFAPDGSAGGQDGCNTFTTSYRVEGSTLTFGPVAGTLIACDQAIMDQAAAFQKMLADTKTFTINGGNLALAGADGKELGTFSPQSTDLSGTKWTVTAYNNGREAVVGVLTGTVLTMDFGADGAVSGNSGCNTFNGPYIIADVTIAIGPLASTDMACAEPEGVMEQETQFLAALQTAATFDLDGNSLTLRNADDAIAAMLSRAP